MPLPIKKNTQKFTYKDYLTWPDNERWELIDGVAYNMSPAPSRQHQEISGELYLLIANYLNGKTCKVYAAPFDVRLAEIDEADEKLETIVQPDIVVVCDKSKLDDKGCKGAPDLVIEISSPNTIQKDMKEKLFIYEKFRVKEYWIVNPIDKMVMVFKAGKNKKYGKPDIYTKEDKIKVHVLKELIIDLNKVFVD